MGLGLIIDTSSDVCIVAVYQEQKLLDGFVQSHANRLSRDLLPAIDTLLKKHHFCPRDLKQIALGIGPGSYTGTRVGAAVAKGLSFSLHIPILTFYSPLAFIPAQTEGPFCLLLPSKAGPFFAVEGVVQNGILSDVSTKIYETVPGGLHLLIEPSSYPPCNLFPLISFLSTQRESSPEEISLIYLSQIPLKNISALL